MPYYYSLFGVAILLGFFFANPRFKLIVGSKSLESGKQKLVYLSFIFLFVFLLVGFRSYTVGADTYGYITQYYYGVINGGILFNKSPELIINIIIWVSHLISKNYQLFLILHAALVSILFLKYILDNSCNVFISCIIFIGMFFVPSMNLMREWLAIGFGLNAETAIRKGNNKKGFFLLIMAILSHLTAVCLFAIVIFDKIRNKKRAFWFFVVFALVFYLLRNRILNLVTVLVPRYYDYVYHDYFISESAFNIKDLIYIIIELYYFYVIFRKKNTVDEDTIGEYYQDASFLLLAIVFSLCGQRFGIVHRMVYYYSVFLISSLPKMIEKNRFRGLIHLALIIGMFVMLYRNSYWDNNNVANYSFFWQKASQVAFL